MKDFMSRKERHEEAIEKFLEDPSKETIEMILYNSEIRYLERHYPGIIILRNSVFKVHLMSCTVFKKK